MLHRRDLPPAAAAEPGAHRAVARVGSPRVPRPGARARGHVRAARDLHRLAGVGARRRELRGRREEAGANRLEGEVPPLPHRRADVLRPIRRHRDHVSSASGRGRLLSLPPVHRHPRRGLGPRRVPGGRSSVEPRQPQHGRRGLRGRRLQQRHVQPRHGRRDPRAQGAGGTAEGRGRLHPAPADGAAGAPVPRPDGPVPPSRAARLLPAM
mmetsp:Transcript_102340/g.289836  ORF Transcript_102340/g.289836 Transcript_102340/m.289836 type:complete len:210 (-) Transcript_102340:600-1229(-)